MQICIDMDGTITDLYNVPNWLELLEQENPAPYSQAGALFKEDFLSLLYDLKQQGYSVSILTWNAKEASREYKKQVRNAKLKWLADNNVPYDTFHCVAYGTNKNNLCKGDGILIDDNEEVRSKWSRGKTYSCIEDFMQDFQQEEKTNNCLPFDWKNGGYSRGKKPQLYLVLDCETATLPFMDSLNLTPEQRQKVGIAKPLIYDIGWQIIDKKGNVYSRHSYLVQETFFVPAVFNTAYYREKRPLYMEMYEKGEITALHWQDICDLLENELQYVAGVCAYNAMFDFKKAIRFTSSYIYHLYSGKYQEWEDFQRRKCLEIARGTLKESDHEFDPNIFEFKGKEYPLFDIWGIVVNAFLNTDKYRKFCIENGYLSNSGLFFKTSAEVAYKFLQSDNDFIEDHTALSDTLIETEMFLKALNKRGYKMEQGIQYFPFRELGTTCDYITSRKRKNGKLYHSADEFDTVIKIMDVKAESYATYNSFLSQLENNIIKLEVIKNESFGKINKERFARTYVRQLKRKQEKLEKFLSVNNNPQMEEELEKIVRQIAHYENYIEKGEIENGKNDK